MTFKSLVAIVTMVLAAAAPLRLEARHGAQQQRPQPGPAPKPAPSPGPRDPIGDYNLPGLETPAQYAARMASLVKQPAVAAGANVLGLFAPIHDGRKAVVDRARQEANAAIKREMKAHNLAEFDYDSCAFTHPACVDTMRRFSPGTNQAINKYLDAQGRYLAWTDMGNVTGKGWTRDEIAGFAGRVTSGVADKLADKLGDRSKQPNWDPDIPDIAGDAAKTGAADRLAEFDKKVMDRLKNAGGRPTPNAEFRATPEELQAAADAAAAQGAGANAVNRDAPKTTMTSEFADGHRQTAREESKRLDGAAKKVEQSLADASANARADRSDIDAKSADLLNAILNEAKDSRTVRQSGPTSSHAGGGADDKGEGPDHCPDGAFVCPNGLPWPKCTHAEKHKCPPPEYAPKGSKSKVAAGPVAKKPATPAPKKPIGKGGA